jgi:CDP-diacylglycerol pyrophosphatase
MKRTAALLIVVLLLPAAAFAAERGLLWRVVQTCMASQSLIGVPFPCLAVDLAGGPARGYAVLRAPFERTHVVVTPTVQTIGIEADRLRADGAPNYFADAWASRHFVTDVLPRKPDRTDLALAVNSRPGRSQDQLHIHVDCIRQTVKRRLAGAVARLAPGQWARVAVQPHGPEYNATVLQDSGLAGANLFRLVRDGLGVGPDDMDDVTIVVIGATLHDGQPGFVVLARQRVEDGRDEAHGEALLDHACSAFR